MSWPRNGGMHFEDCEVYDSAYRPAVQFYEEQTHNGFFDIRGQITVHNPPGAIKAFGDKLENVTLKVVSAE